MDLNKTDNNSSAVTSAEAGTSAGTSSATSSAGGRRPLRVLGAIGLVAAIAGWVAFFFNDTVAAVCAAVGIVLSAAGLFGGRGCLRDICITSLVASVVLVAVYTLFYWGIDYFISTM